jgi:ETC complex I subunit conserved region
MSARISRPAKNAMQSGTAKSTRWLLEFTPEAQARSVEPLMGWTSSTDTLNQVKLWFDTKEEAVAYATREGIAFTLVEPPSDGERRAMAYSDNFKSDRIGTWTH